MIKQQNIENKQLQTKIQSLEADNKTIQLLLKRIENLDRHSVK